MPTTIVFLSLLVCELLKCNEDIKEPWDDKV
jgi:hypothetical protein